MNSLIRKACSILYHTVGFWLPASYTYHSFMGRQFHISYGLYIRRFFAKYMLDKAGKNINIEKYASFGRNVSLGTNSGIGYKCQVAGSTIIGDNVMMGPEVIIFNQNHQTSRTDIPMCEQGFDKILPVKIGNDVWIGRRAIILPGVHISDGCIIGAGAVVTKDIPPFSIAAGNPAKIVKNRLDESLKSRNKSGVV